MLYFDTIQTSMSQPESFDYWEYTVRVSQVVSYPTYGTSNIQFNINQLIVYQVFQTHHRKDLILLSTFDSTTSILHNNEFPSLLQLPLNKYSHIPDDHWAKSSTSSLPSPQFTYRYLQDSAAISPS